MGLLACLAALPAVAKAPASELALPDYKKLTLDNGVTVLLVPRPEVPLVAIEAIVRGGTVEDPAGKEGLTRFTASMLRRGAGERTGEQIALALDSHGARLNVSADRDATWVGIELLAEDAELGLGLLEDMLERPTFPEEEVEKLRARTADGIKAAKEEPRGVLGLYFAGAVFGDHPYGRPTFGTEATVPTFTRDDVQALHAKHMGADRLIIAVGGDFDLATMEEAVRARFGDFRKAEVSLPRIEPAPRTTGRRVLLIDKPDATQTYFSIGNVGVARAYEHGAALDLVRTVFGGRFTSMLNQALRIESGLTYGARFVVEEPLQPGEMAISSFTETSKTKDAIDLALATLGRLHADGLSKDQMASGKAYMRGQLPPTLETAAQLTERIADLTFHGLPDSEVEGYLGRLDAVGPKDVMGVIARDIPKPDDLVFVLIGNASAIRDVAKSYGPVVERSIDDPGF
jgi:predicted Zn-dependent peptidase